MPSDSSRERLDQVLVRRGLATGRDAAAALALAGEVWVDGAQVTKAGKRISVSAQVEVRPRRRRYASRAGGKLEAALERFGVDPSGCVCLDIGASTGGFTDCLLQHGAARVYAVDVGYGQLRWELRTDARVVVLERRNARYLTAEHVSEGCDLAVCDVSFISVTKVLPPVRKLLRDQGAMIVLVKPQFEAGPADVPRGGVVRDPAVHRRVLWEVVHFAQRSGWTALGLLPSPVCGADGNQEFLLLLRPGGAAEVGSLIEGAVAEVSDDDDGGDARRAVGLVDDPAR